MTPDAATVALAQRLWKVCWAKFPAQEWDHTSESVQEVWLAVAREAQRALSPPDDGLCHCPVGTPIRDGWCQVCHRTIWGCD